MVLLMVVSFNDDEEQSGWKMEFFFVPTERTLLNYCDMSITCQPLRRPVP
jgi:hypothetical protein